MQQAKSSTTGDDGGFSGKIGRAYRNLELREAAWFYAAHLASFVLPVLTVAYLARVMGPAEWGRLAVFHSLGLYSSQIMEYGFNFSAARDVARKRSNATERATILGDVHAAKIVLGALLVLGAVALYPFLPEFMRSPLLYALALGYALAQGSSLIWYFQGVGRLAELARIEAVCRSVAAIITILTVRHPDDGWRMIAFNTLSCVAVSTVGLYLISRDTPLLISSAASARTTLKNSFYLFVFRGAASLYGAASGFLLGLLSNTTNVGFYAGGERAYRGFTALLHPMMQLLYTRVNHAMGDRLEFTDEARRIARQSAALMITWGGVLGLLCAAFSPFIVSVLLGRGFEPVVPVLRIFGLMLLLEAASIALGIQWMLPLKLDRQYTAITVAAGCGNLMVAYWLAPTYGAVGMAIAVASGQALSAAGCLAYLRMRKLDPFRRVA